MLPLTSFDQFTHSPKLFADFDGIYYTTTWLTGLPDNRLTQYAQLNRQSLFSWNRDTPNLFNYGSVLSVRGLNATIFETTTVSQHEAANRAGRG